MKIVVYNPNSEQSLWIDYNHEKNPQKSTRTIRKRDREVRVNYCIDQFQP